MFLPVFSGILTREEISSFRIRVVLFTVTSEVNVITIEQNAEYVLGQYVAVCVSVATSCDHP